MGSYQSVPQEPSLWEEIKTSVSQSIETLQEERRKDIDRYHQQQEAIARYHQQQEVFRFQRQREEEIARYNQYRQEAILRHQQQEAFHLQQDILSRKENLALQTQRCEEPLMNYQDDFLSKQRHEEECKDVIYVLQLSQDKWYVGRTSNFERRYSEHKTGNGSVWSKAYLPILSHSIVPCTSNFQEDLVVKEYMLKYEIDNVRGGTYSMITLDNNQKSLLERELSHASNKCFKCGSKDHYANKCFKEESKTVVCYKCKKLGHYANRCDNTKPKNFCSSCGRKEHEDCDNECARKKDRDGNPNGMSSYCKRCGRDSHLYTKCYAKSTYKDKAL